MDILKLTSTIFTIMMRMRLTNLLKDSDRYTSNRVRNGNILLKSIIKYHHQEGIQELPLSRKFMISINTILKSHGKMEESTQLFTVGRLTIQQNKKLS